MEDDDEEDEDEEEMEEEEEEMMDESEMMDDEISESRKFSNNNLEKKPEINMFSQTLIPPHSREVHSLWVYFVRFPFRCSTVLSRQHFLCYFLVQT
jgi:hypothetical protein